MRIIPILSNQRLYTTDSPTFAGLTLTGAYVISTSSVVFQPATDSTTYFQILDADGGTPIFNVDSTNEQIGIGVADPDTILEVYKVGTQLKLSGGADDYATFAVAADGALTITTVDDTAGEGDICLMPDGNVGIGTASPSRILHINQETNAISGVNVDISGLSTAIVNPADDDNEAVGLGFGISTVLTNVGAAIIHEREGSQGYGKLHFATKPSGAASEADIPIRMTIDNGGNVGVGTLTPDTQIEIVKAAANATLTISCYHDTEATTPLFILRKADNTEAAPALVDDNAVLGTILFQAYDGNSWANGAKIETRVKGAPGDGDMPIELTFWTTPDASETLVEQMTIAPDGAVVCTGTIAASNYTAAALLTACATNAGGLDFSAASKTLTVEDSAVVSQDYTSDSTTVVFAALGITEDGATITLKNDVDEYGEGGAETTIKFTDHADAVLAQIQGSHSGVADDHKGKMILSVDNGTNITTAVTIIDTLAVTFAGAISATNYTAANLLTACATNAGELDFTGASKKLDVEDNAVVNQDLTSDADVTFNDITVSTPSNVYALSHDSFADYAADEHVAHAGVTITAGKGLSGGGTIAATRTLALALTEMTGNVTWDDGSTDASITWTYALSSATDPVWTIGDNSMDLTTGILKVGGTTVSAVGHIHDGATLQHDGVNSDGGAFSFTTTGTVTFNQSVAAANYTAAALLTACATNAGALDFSAASKTLTVADSATIGLVIDDLNSLTPPASDGQFIVATGVGAFQYESTTTARTSLGVGTGDSPAFTAVSLGTGELTAGSINRAAGSLLLEIAGTPELSISATASTFGGNIIVPDAADIGSASATNAISIGATGIVDIELHNLSTIGLALAGTLITASAAELNLLDGVSAVQEQADVLDDIINVGTVINDSYFLVGNGAASFAWETTTTLRTSIGVGTGDSVQLASLKLGTANLKAGALFELAEDAVNAEAVLSCYHDTEATTSLLTLRKADGTEAAPALVDDDAVLGTINFDAYDGSGWHTGAKIEARIMGTPSDGTDVPTELTFWNCPDASATLLQRMTISRDGRMGFGTVTPTSTISGIHTFIDISSSVGAATNAGLVMHDAAAQEFSIQLSGGVTIDIGGHATAASNKIVFRTEETNSSFSPTERMRITHDGKIGLNCTGPAGTLSIGDITEGRTASLNVQTTHETHTLAAAATSVTTTLDIPTTALVLGAAFCVNTAVVDDAGNDTWSAAFSGGDASAIVAAVAAAQNTKAHSTVVPALTNAETEITFTPNGGNFSAGIIEVVAWYIDITDLANV